MSAHGFQPTWVGVRDHVTINRIGTAALVETIWLPLPITRLPGNNDTYTYDLVKLVELR